MLSRLPVNLSELLETTCQHGKQPEALAQVGLATPRKFLQKTYGETAVARLKLDDGVARWHDEAVGKRGRKVD